MKIMQVRKKMCGKMKKERIKYGVVDVMRMKKRLFYQINKEANNEK